jgi:hypothetical protein
MRFTRWYLGYYLDYIQIYAKLRTNRELGYKAVPGCIKIQVFDGFPGLGFWLLASYGNYPLWRPVLSGRPKAWCGQRV